MTDGTRQVSFLFLLAEVLRARWRIARWAAVAAVVTAVIVLMLGRTYTARAVFVPADRGAPPQGLAALAAQLGMALPDGGQSPQYYAGLVTSYPVTRKAVESEYEVAERGILGLRETGDTVRGSLVTIFDLDASPGEYERSVARAIERLSDAVRVRTALETGIITMEVTLPWADLAEQVAHVLIRELQQLNVSVRQSQAKAEREFIESRLEALRAELASAENTLREFLEQNRSFRESPALAIRHEELTAEVSLRRQLVLSLAQAYEQARIEEVRSTPVISVLAAPVRPPRPDPRGLVVKSGAAAAVGIILGCLWVMLVATFRSPGSERDPDVVLFRGVVEDVKRDLRMLTGARRRTPDHRTDNAQVPR